MGFQNEMHFSKNSLYIIKVVYRWPSEYDEY